MCTVTLSYDQSNALARRKLAALLATGLFSQLSTDDTPQPTPEEVEAHRQEVEAFLYGSKISMTWEQSDTQLTLLFLQTGTHSDLF